MKHLIFLLLVLFVACDRKVGEIQESELQAEASLDSKGITIRKSDLIDCLTPRVVIITGPTTGYASTPKDIAPKQSVSIPYSDFVDNEGHRFDYGTLKPSKVTLQCSTVNAQSRRVSWQF